MKTRFTLFLILISFQLISQNEIIKYYKHLIFRETPYSEVKGRIEIPVERTKNENYYKLTYDSKNRLTSIQYLFKNKQIKRMRAGLMDGFRNVFSKTLIRYEGNLEIRTFYDALGNQCYNSMNVFKEVYEYNNKGKKSNVKFYNDKGKLTNSTWNIAEYIWNHENNFDVVEKRKNKKGEYVTMRPYYYFLTTLYKYSKEGILISMNHINDKGELINDFDDEKGIAIDKAEYDKDFNLIGFRFYNAKKEAVIGSFLESAGGKITYDKNGNCVKYATINKKGELMLGRDKAYDLYKFDSFGNNIELGHYGLKDQPVEYRGYTKIKFIYDKKNPEKKGKIKRVFFK